MSLLIQTSLSIAGSLHWCVFGHVQSMLGEKHDTMVTHLLKQGLGRSRVGFPICKSWNNLWKMHPDLEEQTLPWVYCCYLNNYIRTYIPDPITDILLLIFLTEHEGVLLIQGWICPTGVRIRNFPMQIAVQTLKYHQTLLQK